MKDIFDYVLQLVSGMFPFVLLCLAGVYFTVKTKAVQVRKFFCAIKTALCVDKSLGSSFGAVCNSLSATIGTGNIAGVAFAISVGGAGAVFWMWISAFFSMAIKAVEIGVALLYRKQRNGEYYGGPMHYIKMRGGKILSGISVVFALSGLGATFFTGNLTQVNACVSVMGDNFYLRLFMGVLIFILVATVIMGGAKKITRFTTIVLPFMAVLYIVLCLAVIFKNYDLIDDAFLSIFKGAFSPHAVTGGAVGSLSTAIIAGAQKGVFSNEAGMGTSGMAYASVQDADPYKQGLFGIFEVFVDTLLICTLTALTILCSSVIINYGTAASSELVERAFSTVYGGFSSVSLAIMLCLFAVSSIIGWAFYGINFAEFLFGKKGKRLFCLIYPPICLLGAFASTDFTWHTAEFFNGIMLIINVTAVWLLSGKAIAVLKGDKNGNKDSGNTKCIRKQSSGANIR